jgi:flagellar biosynthesis protein FliQ
MCGVVDLTPSQSIAIYGWRNPLRILDWKVMLDREDLTFKALYGLGLTEKQLFTLQPDKTAWISEKRLDLDDITLVPKWQVHVTRDMKASFVDIAQMNLSAEFLQHTGVTFEDLVGAGLTLNLMMLLPLTLISWVHLGLHREFLTDLTDVQSHALFHIPKNMVMQCVQEKKRVVVGELAEFT